MSSYKLIYEIDEHYHIKAQVEGKFNYPKVEYKIQFEGQYLCPDDVRRFISRLNCKINDKTLLVEILGQDLIRCDDKIYKVDRYTTKEEKDVFKIELDLKVITCVPL